MVLLFFGGLFVVVNKLFELGRFFRFLYLGFLFFSKFLLRFDLRIFGEKIGFVVRLVFVFTNFTRLRNVIIRS